MESCCKGCVVCDFEADEAAFRESYVSQKQSEMLLSFKDTDLVPVEFASSSNDPHHSVFHIQGIVREIFSKLDSENRANMAVVCPSWSQMFLTSPDAPGVSAAYWLSLKIKEANGILSIRRGPNEIFKMCKCLLTDDMDARKHIHYRQYTHPAMSNLLNDIDPATIDDYHMQKCTFKRSSVVTAMNLLHTRLF